MPTPRNYLDAWRTGLFVDKQARVLIVRINPPRLAQLARLMADGKLRSIVTERFTLANTAPALTRSTTGHVRGKIVVEP
jgi:NADPH:quinone reductase-like Zn-dependent oxidoreductase